VKSTLYCRQRDVDNRTVDKRQARAKNRGDQYPEVTRRCILDGLSWSRMWPVRCAPIWRFH